jgi:hypothetical protein
MISTLMIDIINNYANKVLNIVFECFCTWLHIEEVMGQILDWKLTNPWFFSCGSSLKGNHLSCQ